MVGRTISIEIQLCLSRYVRISSQNMITGDTYPRPVKFLLCTPAKLPVTLQVRQRYAASTYMIKQFWGFKNGLHSAGPSSSLRV